MAPEPAFCFEKKRLIAEFVKAVSEYHRMQSAQLAALRKGEDFPFEAELSRAREQRDRAKYSVLAHQELHGC
jgi:hypothetical protein